MMKPIQFGEWRRMPGAEVAIAAPPSALLEHCASVSELAVDAETDAACDRFPRSISCYGICEIETKWDSHDGPAKLIEANPCLSAGRDAVPYDGVDLCWLHCLDLMGQPEATTRSGRPPFGGAARRGQTHDPRVREHLRGVGAFPSVGNRSCSARVAR